MLVEGGAERQARFHRQRFRGKRRRLAADRRGKRITGLTGGDTRTARRMPFGGEAHPDPEHGDLNAHRDACADSAVNHGRAASDPPPGS
jgi:hypothetical protein